MARALTADLAGAAEDFQAAINQNVFAKESEAKQCRIRWVEALKNGVNPFTAEEMAALQAAEG
ncbi:hypothetical protein BST81_26735 [Leptolyngbya sp. 'hensonii']|uniref:hypothetical protein n=1 Tax=Leptolyngbya sp. 'hensonii' TaxID=1922337 RepID=UPI00094F75FA|nr:hypothetical protein [Leptolyngbya sp. 'hensonii']OLP15383.1 hypothetical protein BST81_26735 [Leptolyngbya sp. 'hensonii']